MRILNLCKDEQLFQPALEKIQDAEEVLLSAVDRKSFENVLEFVSNNGITVGEFAMMGLRYVRKYDCSACLLDHGDVADLLNRSGIGVLVPMTVTRTLTKMSRDGELKSETEVRCAGFVYHKPDGESSLLMVGNVPLKKR